MTEIIKVNWLEITDSTNLEASRNIDKGEDFEVWFAEFQTAGRGQRGNKWESAKSQNLTFSILMKPYALLAKDQYVISQIVTLGIIDYLATKDIRATVKWPNDIYVCDRKICGILIENSLVSDKLATSIAGIGLNVNQVLFNSDAPNPTSVKSELIRRGLPAEDMNLKRELYTLLNYIYYYYYRLTPDIYTSIKRSYHESLYKLGIRREFMDMNVGEKIYGQILGVDDSFLLNVELDSGEIRKYAFKEIDWITVP